MSLAPVHFLSAGFSPPRYCFWESKLINSTLAAKLIALSNLAQANPRFQFQLRLMLQTKHTKW